jgi:hypothetical protein
MSSCDPGRVPLLTGDQRLQLKLAARLSGADRVRISLGLCALGRKIMLSGLHWQFGADGERIQREFRRRMLGAELARELELHLAGKRAGT